MRASSIANIISNFSKYKLNRLKEAAAEDILEHVLQTGAVDIALLPRSGGGVDPLRHELVFVLEFVSADEPESRVLLVNLDGDGSL